MRLKFRILCLGLTMGLPATFFGCLEGEQPPVVSTAEIQVLSIDPAQGTIVTRDSHTVCSQSYVSTYRIDVRSSRYSIRDGRLLIWDEGFCLADISVKGSSKNITGNWSAKGFRADSIPAAFRPEVCQDEIDVEREESFFRRTTIHYAISESRVRETLTGELCLAEEKARGMAYSDNYELFDKNCGSVKMRNVDSGYVALITSVLRGDKVTYTFAYGEKSCSVWASISRNTSCEEVDAQRRRDNVFQDCMEKLGFYTSEDPPQKTGARAPQSFEIRPFSLP